MHNTFWESKDEYECLKESISYKPTTPIQKTNDFLAHLPDDESLVNYYMYTRELHSSRHIFPNFIEKYTEDVKFHKLIKI